MTEPRLDLADTLALVWTRLVAAPRDRDCPFRTPALATVRDSGAEARLVVLRGAEADPPRLSFHTDAASAKVSEISRNPLGTLLFWDPSDALQIRIRARLSARPGTPQEWNSIPHAARRAYGGSPPPGTVIASPLDHDATPAQRRHVILAAEVIEIETLWIDRAPHVRAVFQAESGFSGQWLAP